MPRPAPEAKPASGAFFRRFRADFPPGVPWPIEPMEILGGAGLGRDAECLAGNLAE